MPTRTRADGGSKNTRKRSSDSSASRQSVRHPVPSPPAKIAGSQVSAAIERSRALVRQSQALLSQFLRIEIDLGFSLLSTLSSSRDLDARSRRLASVRDAMRVIHSLVGRVSDVGVREHLQSKLTQLESAFSGTVGGKTPERKA